MHRADCANAVSLMEAQATRMIEVDWDGEGQFKNTFTAGIEVVALDRSKLLADVAAALVEQRVNIVSCETLTGADREAKMRFEFEMSSSAQLGSVLNTIKRIDAVYDVHRIVPGHES